MHKVNTPDGERYLVQLVGPASYRLGGQITYRGQTLTVTKKTRDYLVRKTRGAWADFDPNPPEPVQEVLPPQFGEPGGPAIDMDDLDPEKNPALSMQQAQALAEKSGPIDPIPDSPDMSDLNQKPAGSKDQGDGSGDMTSADLKSGQKASGGGGATAKKAGVNIKTKPATKDADAVTVE